MSNNDTFNSKHCCIDYKVATVVKHCKTRQTDFMTTKTIQETLVKIIKSHNNAPVKTN